MARKLITRINNEANFKTATVYFDSDWEQYQVVERATGSTYYTDDKDDAIGTAKHMVGLPLDCNERAHLR
jgi:hypothetical protein